MSMHVWTVLSIPACEHILCSGLKMCMLQWMAITVARWRSTWSHATGSMSLAISSLGSWETPQRLKGQFKKGLTTSLTSHSIIYIVRNLVNSVYKSRYKAKYRVQYIAQLQIILSCRWLLVVSSLSYIVPTTVSKRVPQCVIMAAIPTVILGSEIKTSMLVLQPGKTIHYSNTFLSSRWRRGTIQDRIVTGFFSWG